MNALRKRAGNIILVLLLILTVDITLSSRKIKNVRVPKLSEFEVLKQRTFPPPNENDNDIFTNLRIATFGSSRTWGSGIQNPERDSFPSLLGAKNLAIRASGPEYPAVCTYSMVGDEIYDVIVMEYMLDFVSDALTVLAQRLRNRFPDAILIFLNVWAPRQYTYAPTNETLNTIVHHKLSTESSLTPLDCVMDIMEGTKPGDWTFQSYNREAIQDVADKVGGWIIDLQTDNDPIRALREVVPLYLVDLTHFSELGHIWVRDMVLEIVFKAQAKPSARIKPWEYTDQCYSWYQTGKTNFVHNMDMVDFGSGTKFALESRPNPYENYIQINNTWNRPAFLFVSYMRHGPEQIYPDVLCRVIQDGNETCANVVHPCIDQTPFGNPIHLVNHYLIGQINPDLSTLTIKELTKKEKEHFRLVGVMLSLKVFGHFIFAAF
jgi:hypothetical protein